VYDKLAFSIILRTRVVQERELCSENRMAWDKRNNILFVDGVLDTVKIFKVTQIRTCSWITNKYTKWNFSNLGWCL